MFTDEVIEIVNDIKEVLTEYGDPDPENTILDRLRKLRVLAEQQDDAFNF